MLSRKVTAHQIEVGIKTPPLKFTYNSTRLLREREPRVVKSSSGKERTYSLHIRVRDLKDDSAINLLNLEYDNWKDRMLSYKESLGKKPYAYDKRQDKYVRLFMYDDIDFMFSLMSNNYNDTDVYKCSEHKTYSIFLFAENDKQAELCTKHLV
jgi:hypothetical protein